MATGGAARLSIDSSGNVGIGTAASTFSMLTVWNASDVVAASFYGDSNYGAPAQLQLAGKTNTNQSLQLGYNTTSNYGSVQSYNAVGQPLMLNPIGGNVGVGTTSAAATLDVYGTASVSSSTETASAYAASSTAYTIPDSTINIRRVTLNNNTTVTLPAFSSASAIAKVWTLTVMVQQDSTGGRTLTFAAPSGDTILWDQGAIDTSAPNHGFLANNISVH